MFSSHAPSSSPYAPVLDHRSSRSPPSPASPLPTGECRFILLHPSIQNQRCSCQGFRLNRTVPGSSCECGHQACYHVPATPSHDNINLVSFTQHFALMDKVRKLEEELADAHSAQDDTQKELEYLQKARAEDVIHTRDTTKQLMRQMWLEVERKLVGMDDKVEAAVDMASGTKDDMRAIQGKIESVEDSTMALEARIEVVSSDIEDHTGKRRRTRNMSSSPSYERSSAQNFEYHSPLSRNDPSSASATKTTTSPHPTPSSLSRSPSPPSASVATSNLNPASDFASPAESIKAYAPTAIAKSKSSTISRDTNSASPYDTFDTPSPVDFLASIASMPMKRQIREVDNGIVEALDSTAGKNARVIGDGKKRMRVVVGAGVQGAGEGAGAREIGVVKEKLLSMPVGVLSFGNPASEGG